MGKPGIPKYGKNFRLVHLPFNRMSEYADRKYEFKADRSIHIRSNRTSEKWYIFHYGQPVANTSTLREAMQMVMADR